MKKLLLYVVAVTIIVLFAYGAWRANRWFNWEFGYSGKVENRIEKLESRVDSLESEIKILEKKHEINCQALDYLTSTTQTQTNSIIKLFEISKTQMKINELKKKR